MIRYLIPLGIFLVMAAFLGLGLKLDPREVPSPFIDRQSPTLDLPRLYSNERITNSTYAGKTWILNVWASWCVACRAEHDLLLAYARSSDTPLVGLNYKDTGTDAKGWLQKLGNPYTAIAVDFEGDAGIEWGVYGVPETFIMDANGVVRYKHIGPLNEEVMQNKVIPLIRQLEGNS
ncbi:MAG: cytochrome c biogenesis protein CcmG/thiol:disulfide interchange protein DsbE [Parasphingorhabdus sp.]|jgi:cytochrome c biogenesis protein CcmG/thiol:disulfide interchange protein DsbE